VKTFLLTLGLVAVGASPSAAQGAAAAQAAAKDVAYVETVRGRVVASAQGNPTLLDVLDIIGDQTRLDLQANSELRICHYGMRKIVRMKGPLQASISASGATAQNSKGIDTTSEACAEPVVSTVQGGFVTRSVNFTTANVPLRPKIKVVNRGSKPIRRVALWDNLQRTTLATFERDAASPTLDEGKSYLLVVEQDDGSELKMLLQASRANQTGPLIVVVR
jgi:hypothetical protein